VPKLLNWTLALHNLVEVEIVIWCTRGYLQISSVVPRPTKVGVLVVPDSDYGLLWRHVLAARLQSVYPNFLSDPECFASLASSNYQTLMVRASCILLV